MAYAQDHRPIHDDSRREPNRPLEPRPPMNAEHASPTTSLLILAGIVAAVLLGSGRMIAHMWFIEMHSLQ